jgi:hypothetical protein
MTTRTTDEIVDIRKAEQSNDGLRARLEGAQVEDRSIEEQLRSAMAEREQRRSSAPAEASGKRQRGRRKT